MGGLSQKMEMRALIPYLLEFPISGTNSSDFIDYTMKMETLYLNLDRPIVDGL